MRVLNDSQHDYAMKTILSKMRMLASMSISAMACYASYEPVCLCGFTRVENLRLIANVTSMTPK